MKKYHKTLILNISLALGFSLSLSACNDSYTQTSQAIQGCLKQSTEKECVKEFHIDTNVNNQYLLGIIYAGSPHSIKDLNIRINRILDHTIPRHVIDDHTFQSPNYIITSLDQKARHWLTTPAKQGNQQAQILLGIISYLDDPKTALNWLKTPANKGNATAQMLLAKLYMDKQDYQKAYELFSKSAKQGNRYAQGYLADIYYYGNDATPKDYKKALSWYNKASKNGNQVSQIHLSLIYYMGNTGKLDPKQAFKILTDYPPKGTRTKQYMISMLKSAQHKEPKGYLQLAKFLSAPLVGDYDQATKYYLLAYKDDPKTAYLSIAKMYYTYARDYDQAIKYYLLAYKDDPKTAYLTIAKMYENTTDAIYEARKYYILYNKNNNTKINLLHIQNLYKYVSNYQQQAIKYYLLARKEGDKDAYLYLAHMYMKARKYNHIIQYEYSEDERKKEHILLDQIHEYKLQDQAQAIKYYALASKDGNKKAYLPLANMYEHSTHDYKQAEKYYLLNSKSQNNKGYKSAYYFTIGSMYEKTANDYKQAKKYYLLAHQAGNTQAYSQLGEMYKESVGNYPQSIKYYLLASKENTHNHKDNKDTYKSIAQAYEDFHHYNQAVKYYALAGPKYHIHYHDAEQWLESKANKTNNKETEYAIGLMYEHEHEHEHDSDQGAYDYLAEKWYLKSAKQGHVLAQYRLGKLYTGTNDDKSRYWYEKSAKQGYADAQYQIAYIYFHAIGVLASERQSRNWFLKSAHQGNAKAQAYLGYMYDHSIGLKRSLAKAVYWYTKSANQGDRQALLNLGIKYYEGKGVKRNYRTAINLTLKSAKQGQVTAQTNLGDMYQHTKKYLKAYAWAYIGAQNGGSDENLRDVEKRLSKDQILKAQALAKELKTTIKKPNPNTIDRYGLHY